MWTNVRFLFQLTIGLFISQSEGLLFNPTSEISSSGSPPIPQYRFHYYVRDENTGDYKSQEEHRSGDSVTGSYMVGEPNGDLRIVKYTADVSNGFKADVNVQPGASPVKPNAIGSKKGVDSFGNQRTGISAPPKQRKPARGFNPVVVKSLSSYTQLPQQVSSKSESTVTSSPQSAYSYYREASTNSQNLSIADFTTPVIPQKSVQVELTYKDDTVVEKTSEKVILEKKISDSSTESTSTSENKNFNLQSLTYLSTETPTSKIPPTDNPTTRTTPSLSNNGLYQFDNMDIPSSVIEIVNQQKSDFKNRAHKAPTYIPESSIPTVSTELPLAKQEPTESTPKTQITTESDLYKKINLPQRPMRLIGLSPIYMDHSQLQSVTENLTSPSQVPLDHIVNIQYATPSPFLSGPLMGGPGPFRNIPRYVSELSDTSSISTPPPNNLPLINSLPISAPIISQAETKQEIKPSAPPAYLPLCNDCLLPANYMPYPLAKSPTANNQKPCATENTPYWAPYKPGFAYILMPSQIIKNNLS